ncbi:FAD-binding oxidoreductase [Glutamicibacter uratoxydans]|uniref:FAD-binding oxidoreductase n=1 Tax=Glutamicibacter uratoxydans TaxID=43667 RepID=UPI003D6EC262
MSTTTRITAADFTGSLVHPGDPDFEDARVGRVFNGRRPDRTPAAVLLAATEEDVALGVRLATQEGWAVSVRSGGHSWAVWSVRNGTLLIDLGLLQNKGYDDETGIVWANPAVQGGAVLSPYLEERGRFFSGGHCPSVGIGGFLLQGGQGWCQRGWGWAAESVVAIDMVNAAGELIRADSTQNQDLYWAARGAGPSFPGIVTRFHIQTNPIFKHLARTIQLFALEDFDELMAWLYTVHADISENVEIVVISKSMEPDEHGVVHRRLVLSGVALTDSAEEGAQALAPFADNPILDRALAVEHAAESTLKEQRVEQEAQNPEHARYIVDNIWTSGEPAEVIKRINPLFTDLPSEQAFTIWFSNGIMRPLPDMAFSMQSEAYVASYMVYEDATKDSEYRALLDRHMEYAQPITVGQYLGDSDQAHRQVKFMADENYAKLQEIIAEHDPHGRFVRYMAKDPATMNRNHWDVKGVTS